MRGHFPVDRADSAVYRIAAAGIKPLYQHVGRVELTVDDRPWQSGELSSDLRISSANPRDVAARGRGGIVSIDVRRCAVQTPVIKCLIVFEQRHILPDRIRPS